MNRFLVYWMALGALLISSLSWATMRNAATDWQLVHTPAPLLTCTYLFYTFADAIHFVDRVADIAHVEHRYPDMYLFDRNKVRIDVYTPGAYDVTEYDAYMAQSIDQLFFREFAY